MRAAVLLVNDGKSIREAAKAKGVSFQTLHRYVKKMKEQGQDVRMCPKYNSRQIFTEEQEEILAEYLQVSSKMRYGVTPLDCRRLAFQMATRNNIPVPIT